MKPETVAIATLGIDPTQSRALIAATKVLEGRLPAVLDWFEQPTEAAVVVQNLDCAPPAVAPEWEELSESAVIVPYRSAGTAPARGISRPLRMSMLQDALTWALEQAVARRQPSAETIGRKVYRGREQAITTPTTSAEEVNARRGDTSSSTSEFVRVYRGRSLK